MEFLTLDMHLMAWPIVFNHIWGFLQTVFNNKVTKKTIGHIVSCTSLHKIIDVLTVLVL
jgi:hypothetical protein